MAAVRAPDNRPKLRVIAGQGAGAASQPSDEELIDAVVRGDASVAGALYDRLLPLVDATLFRMLGTRLPDHDDLVQASFEQIVKTLTTRRFARACSLRTWASSIAANVALNALRSRVRERRVVDRNESAAEASERSFARDDPERDLTLSREIAKVRAALREMNPQRAEALVLHDVLGHDLAEVAALLGVSIAAAQSRLVRGRRELKQRLESEAAGADRGGVP
jgi:RNA polymerase sigma-70 factor, ECF subfamily